MLSKNPRYFSGDALSCDEEPKLLVCEEMAHLRLATFLSGVTGFCLIVALEESKKEPFPPYLQRAYVYSRLDLELSAPASLWCVHVGRTKKERRERAAELKEQEDGEKWAINQLAAELDAATLARLNQEFVRRKANVRQVIRAWKARYPALYAGDHGWWAKEDSKGVR